MSIHIHDTAYIWQGGGQKKRLVLNESALKETGMGQPTTNLQFR
jgi:hypothetical protein